MDTRISEIAGQFAMMPDWTDRFNYLIEIGEELPAMPEELKQPAYRIECNSRLYFHVSFPDGVCSIHASSNTPVPAGLAALLRNIFHGLPEIQVRQYFHLFTGWLSDCALLENLTIARRIAFIAMIEKIANNSK